LAKQGWHHTNSRKARRRLSCASQGDRVMIAGYARLYLEGILTI